MVKQKVSSKVIEEILKHLQEIVKNNPKGDNYDVTKEGWWETVENERDKELRRIIKELEKSENLDKDKKLLLELFSVKEDKEEQEYYRPLFNQNIGKIIQAINEGNKEKISELKSVVLEIKESEKYKPEWADKIFKILDKPSKQIRTNLEKVISEIWYRLSPEKRPLFNACSRDILSKFYEFNPKDYNEFKEAFEKFKEHYQKIIERLPNSQISILNREIDMCLNYYDKNKEGKKFLKNLLKRVKNNNYEEKQEKLFNKNLEKILNAINTKPFIILSGISGTGKTQIARLISAGIVKIKEK